VAVAAAAFLPPVVVGQVLRTLFFTLQDLRVPAGLLTAVSLLVVVAAALLPPVVVVPLGPEAMEGPVDLLPSPEFPPPTAAAVAVADGRPLAVRVGPAVAATKDLMARPIPAAAAAPSLPSEVRAAPVLLSSCSADL
jgi:hypothetical protein